MSTRRTAGGLSAHQAWPARTSDVTDRKSLLALRGVGPESETESVRFRGSRVTKSGPGSQTRAFSACGAPLPHHKSSIKFGYRCFDRILLNGLIQPFQQPERVIGFFNACRDAEGVTRNRLRNITQQFQNWLKNRCEKWGIPVLDAPEGRRDDFVDPYFKQAKTDEVVAILKAREPARIMIAIGSEDRWHLQLAQRWSCSTTFTLTTNVGVGCSCECGPICPFQRVSN
jgi:hypothetical protein